MPFRFHEDLKGGPFDAHTLHHYFRRSAVACRNFAGHVSPPIRNWDFKHRRTHRHDPRHDAAKGRERLYLVFEHMSFEELSDAVLEAAAAKDQHAHSLATLESPALGYSYGLTDRVMVSVQLPYVVRTGIREASHHHDEAEEAEEHHHAEVGGRWRSITARGESETVDRGDTDGIGDLTLFGQYRFYGQDTGLQASFFGGIKTPTGETGERDDQGELFEAEFQPGSGSWDPMLGLALSRAQSRWSVDGNVLYTIATEGTQYTDLGDRFHYNGAVTYRLKGGDAEASHEVADHHSHYGQSHHHDHASEPERPRDRRGTRAQWRMAGEAERQRRTIQIPAAMSSFSRLA